MKFAFLIYIGKLYISTIFGNCMFLSSIIFNLMFLKQVVVLFSLTKTT